MISLCIVTYYYKGFKCGEKLAFPRISSVFFIDFAKGFQLHIFYYLAFNN